jgi:DsbC/DsbD-like thiol-disulfide interchange protein
MRTSRAFSLQIALLVIVLVTPGLTRAEPLAVKHARIDLISDSSAIKTGQDLLLGIHFLLEPGWHIYWVNPGDSGQPPVLKWQLPPGFTAGEVQWPQPHRLQSSPQIVDYGYRDDVLLMVPIHVARFDNIGSAGSPLITLDAKWLICREVCLPDHAQLHLSLPFASSPQHRDADSAPLFANAKKLLPRPLPPTWRTAVESGKDTLTLAIRAGKPIGDAEFFPLDPGQIENAAPQKIIKTATGMRIMFRKSDLLVKPIAVLRGVLVLAPGEAYRLDAPVTTRR